MKNLVLTVNIQSDSSKYQSLFETSILKTKEYADKVKADFVCIKNDDAFPGFKPTWQRFALFTEAYKNYDNILYLDSDLIITDHAPNIFNIMNNYDSSVFAAIDYESIKARKYTGYFNAGLFALKRSWINLWKIEDINTRMNKWQYVSHMDQCCLNEMVKDTCDGYINLGRSWNTMTSNIELFPIVYGAHYIHYHKTKFDLLKIQQYNSSVRNVVSQEKFFTFPDWWKKYDFYDIVKMEADYSNFKGEV